VEVYFFLVGNLAVEHVLEEVEDECDLFPVAEEALFL
jgi:hypothetical protein